MGMTTSPPTGVMSHEGQLATTLRGPVPVGRQFHLGPSPPPIDGMEHVATIGTLALHVGPGLPVVPVLDVHGDRIGLFLGMPIAIEEERVLTGSEPTSLAPDETSFVASMEDFVYGHGGSWIFILDTPRHHRLYLDASGTLSVVFHAERGCAASSASALLDADEYEQTFRDQLFRSLDVAHEGWFPSGLTAHRGVTRLLCNHFLDLGDFRTERHWPIDDVRDNLGVEDAALRISHIARSIGRAVLPLDPVCSLTGGNETRFLLAALRELHDDVLFMTIQSPATARDVALARRLSDEFGLRHAILPARWATPEQQGSWLRGAGHAVGGSKVMSHPTLWGLTEHHGVQLGGLGGEVGRAFIWRPGDDETTELTPSGLVSRLGLPASPIVDAATATWLETVPEFSPLCQLDLAYLELRHYAWGFASSYANAPGLPLVHPLITRESFRLMMALEPRFRRESTYIRAGIEQQWPELLTVPVNRYGDARDALHLLRRASSPRRVAKKLRKLFR